MLINGILLGLTLSILVGPLLFALIQTSLEEGSKAGFAVGIGIWFSDALFILATYYGLSYVEEITEWSGFELALGIGGGVVLFLFGLGILLSKPIPLEKLEGAAMRFSSYPTLLTKGFLINTINPFTVFFWTGVASTIISRAEPENALWFYIGLFGTIVASDSLKVVLAKVIRPYLRPKVLYRVRQISGIALIIFGVVLLVRVTLV